MNRKLGVQILILLTTLLFILTVFSSTVQSIPPVPKTTWIVDINGNGDYTSIQDAIDNAAATDTIRIREGVYKENNLEIYKKLTIIGDNPTNTLIDFGMSNGFTLYSSYVDISNLKLINPGEYAIYVQEDGYRCTISKCIIKVSENSIGIWIRAPSAVVSNCSITGVSSTGIGIKLRGYNSTIKNCDIYRFSVGVLALIDAHNHKIMECNLFNNKLAVEIRINSNNNILSNCNIYGNKNGVYIWQNSNNNLVYYNNFWKNDVGSIDESNNTWDNGVEGNFWDDYTGIDSNGDGIGDTPYIISAGNNDEFPLMSIILPDVITVPTSVKLVTASSENTPSFTWDPSIYSKGINGYYVNIDSNPELFVGDTNSWASLDALLDGVHTFYVWAEGKDNTISDYAFITFSIDTIFIDTDRDGWSDEEEQEYGTDPNDPGNYPLDTDNDRISDSVDTDDDNDGYSDDMELSYGADAKDSNDRPPDTDGDGIPDEDSPDGKYTGDIDDDDDGLIDTIEIQLGSNSKNGADAKKIYISGKPYHLVDISQNGFYDILYNPLADITTAVEYRDGNYLINENGDGEWDYIYNVENGEISRYGENMLLSPSFWIYLILGMFIILTLIALYYIGRKWIKDRIPRRPKRVVKELPVKRSVKVYTREPETAEMIGQTRMILHNIQEGISVYMDQLHQIEEQIAKASVKEPAIVSKEMVSTKVTNIRNRWFIKKEQVKQEQIKPSTGNVEEMVDEFLTRLEKKEKNGKGK